MLPPAGDPPPRNERIIAVQATSGTLLSISCVTVLVRCYVRIFIKKAFGWDDWMMVLAMLFYALLAATSIGSTLYGTGYKFEQLTVHQSMTAMKYWWVAEVGYCFSSVFCKISVCIFLLRITVRREHRWVLYTIMGFTSVSGLIFMLTMMLQCQPVKYFWTQAAAAVDPSIKGHCNIDRVVIMTYVYSGFAALCDLTVGFVPIWIVKGLQMKRSTKIAIGGILGVACIASSGALARTAFVETFRDPEFLYATVWIGVWSNVETGLGITAGSLATLRPLTVRWFGSSRPDRYYSMEMQAQDLSDRPSEPRPRRRWGDSLLFSTVNNTTFDHERGKTVTEVSRYETENPDSAGSRDGSQEALPQNDALRQRHDQRPMEIVVQRTVEVARPKQ
ncbi:hypothetical protein FE257_010459 [Aspergillus nanangensis]|uniref:Rhodopsin domain-containing protein n=1 Tax=Aspergillus nanangensis TaxID=2582783 RepID=A0AAD4CIN4_ASPNN|nr:hypothetical protein FE257_010459 [Aspergillus nanangensis]